jgi:hypothetical protein
MDRHTASQRPDGLFLVQAPELAAEAIEPRWQVSGGVLGFAWFGQPVIQSHQGFVVGQRPVGLGQRLPSGRRTRRADGLFKAEKSSVSHHIKIIGATGSPLLGIPPMRDLPITVTVWRNPSCCTPLIRISNLLPRFHRLSHPGRVGLCERQWIGSSRSGSGIGRQHKRPNSR